MRTNLVVILDANNFFPQEKLAIWGVVFSVLSLNTPVRTQGPSVGHRAPHCRVTGAVHAAAGLFCFGEDRRKLSPRGEIPSDSN